VNGHRKNYQNLVIVWNVFLNGPAAKRLEEKEYYLEFSNSVAVNPEGSRKKPKYLAFSGESCI
jgi:hypothetical protein